MEMATQPVRMFYERLARADLDGALALLAADVELIQADSLPYGGRYVGQAGIRDFFTRFFAYWQQFRSEEVVYFANADQVVVTSVAHGLTRQGRSVVVPMVQVYALRDGLIREVRPFYFDTARLT
ncbi:MAG: nuclear transport factor 2 family protein [Ferruginibacter sp.]|nr:nuclear transport factor 2 family protein [Cytophagales bacterium]